MRLALFELLLSVDVLAAVAAVIVERRPRPIVRPLEAVVVVLCVETEVVGELAAHDKLFAEHGLRRVALAAGKETAMTLEAAGALDLENNALRAKLAKVQVRAQVARGKAFGWVIALRIVAPEARRVEECAQRLERAALPREAPVNLVDLRVEGERSQRRRPIGSLWPRGLLPGVRVRRGERRKGLEEHVHAAVDLLADSPRRELLLLRGLPHRADIVRVHLVEADAIRQRVAHGGLPLLRDAQR
mmetsp:Transcript_10785/g.32733  ORF Transcript_10785/g.32733 Transcript_10785/m.32733 type:complete len:245 (-) Transcript_10785:567-1301(-)